MGFLRKLFVNGYEGGHHRRRAKGRYERYRPDGQDEHGDQGESRGRHPGSIPPLPPDLVCPQCRKSNPPGTRRCRQCDTVLEHATCGGCGAAVQADARYCANCGNQMG